MIKGYEVKISVNPQGSFTSLLAPKVVSALQESVQTSLSLVRSEWQKQAQQKLNTSRQMYLQGLDFTSTVYPVGNAFTGVVALRGKLPNMFETGFTPFDMKVGFSKSPRKKSKADGGWYLTIPMRHWTPSTGRADAMPMDIYKKARILQPKQGLVDTSNPDSSWNGYTHKSSVYSGMQRIVKSYKNTSQAHYLTFRRVSDKSNPMSWSHPGYSGANLITSMIPYAQKTFKTVIETNLKEVMK